jgi:hypothetical protein
MRLLSWHLAGETDKTTKGVRVADFSAKIRTAEYDTTALPLLHPFGPVITFKYLKHSGYYMYHLL